MVHVFKVIASQTNGAVSVKPALPYASSAKPLQRESSRSLNTSVFVKTDSTKLRMELASHVVMVAHNAHQPHIATSVFLRPLSTPTVHAHVRMDFSTVPLPMALCFANHVRNTAQSAKTLWHVKLARLDFNLPLITTASAQETISSTPMKNVSHAKSVVKSALRAQHAQNVLLLSCCKKTTVF